MTSELETLQVQVCTFILDIWSHLFSYLFTCYLSSDSVS